MSNSAPSTPLTQTTRTVISDAPTGTWRHPRLDEINRRISASTFGERNIKSILLNVILFVSLMLLPRAKSLSSALDAVLTALTPYTSYAFLLCRIIPWLNIALAMLPLFRGKDDLSDIPLTPTQRSLLGLPPATRAASPGSTYITPPRYSKTPGSRTSSKSGSPSPYSGSSPSGTIRSPTSYSPSPSPMFQKALGNDVTRRLSYGSPSPLAMSRTINDSSSSFTPSTPSPVRGPSVSLTSRWLYEKGRMSPSTKGIYA